MIISPSSKGKNKHNFSDKDKEEDLQKSPPKKAKVSLKMIEIKIEDEIEVDESDLSDEVNTDEFYYQDDINYHTVKDYPSRGSCGPAITTKLSTRPSSTNSNKNYLVDAQTDHQKIPYQRWVLNINRNTDSGSVSNYQQHSESLRHQTKHVIWGGEVPRTSNVVSLDSDQASSLMNLGTNPLITIRPAGRNENKEDIVITSGPLTTSLKTMNSSNRMIDLDQLRNYFLLDRKEDTTTGYNVDGGLTRATSQEGTKMQYFLSLLDPSMPRLTNCGYYFRMRYAVYVSMKQWAMYKTSDSSSTSNWRKRRVPVERLVVSSEDRNSGEVEVRKNASSLLLQQRKNPLLHIGEMHLYTIFPKDDKLDQGNFNIEQLPRWCKDGKSNFIHYENISFFQNQTPLNMEEEALMRVTETDIGHMIQNFRRVLKLFNSIDVPSSVISDSGERIYYISTYLLEKLKYPKLSDDITKPDRTCEQFFRNQMEMFARYEAYFNGSGYRSSKINERGELEGESFSYGGSAFSAYEGVNESGNGSDCGNGLETKMMISMTKPSPSISAKDNVYDYEGKVVDLMTADSLVTKLYRLKNQAESKFIEA